MSDLHHVMERVGRIVAADQLLRVDVRGVAAYSMKGRVVVPAIENYAWLGEHAGRMLHGLLDHECGHASFTDFDEVKRIVEEHPPAFKALWNALEDGMIERMKGEQFRGCAQNLRQIHEWYWDHGGEGDQPIWGVIQSLPDLWTVFCLAANAVVTPYGGKTLEQIEELRPEAAMLLREVEEHWSQVATATTTQEITAITQAIWDHFATLAREYEGDGEGDCRLEGVGSDEDGDEDADIENVDCVDAEDADDADDASRGGRKGKGKGSKKAKGKAKAKDKAGDEGDEGDRGGKGDPPFRDLERWTRDDGVPLDPSQAINVRVRRIFEQPSDVQPYIVFSHEYDLVRDFSAETHRHGGDRFEQDFAEARAASEALTIAFETALRAKRDLRAIGGYDEGTPDPNLLGEYAVGACPADQLYQQFVAEDSDEVAVSILFDCSGSMGNGYESKSRLAKLTGLALHQALSTCQLVHEMCGFTTYESRYPNDWADGQFESIARENMDRLITALREAEAHGTDIERFARCVRSGWHGTRVYQVPFYAVFKDFSTADVRGLERIAGLNHNLDGEAVLWQARRLAQRPEKRRVMFVLSDGMPEGSRDNAQGARYLKEAVQRVAASGIEIYGIGMQSAAVSKFYPTHWVCHDMEDLSRLAMTAMTEVLLRSRTERAWVKVA